MVVLFVLMRKRFVSFKWTFESKGKIKVELDYHEDIPVPFIIGLLVTEQSKLVEQMKYKAL